ncbi:MAG: Re/Si-specific NAD(P)(+) transhydrogenase subunit alpha [Actinobacteria bacterium]|nr:Re/Si-specific NAD(P)(+) transhydrogenase subunit alpha [Actinomycetota bacterium]MCL6095097.1 Re/Si-specific NAD(P)(+) transhydrogenase subunit alpha [Actinomycetota bacterium]
MVMKLVVPTETLPGERRVAIVPDVVGRLTQIGCEVQIQSGAGSRAHFPDDAYEAKGASIVKSFAEAMAGANLVVKVQPPSLDEIASMTKGTACISLLQPMVNLEIVKALASRGVDSFSLDLLPRISRAQSMDVLSSQATVTGYRGVIVAASNLEKFFPMFMTAAGTVPPAKVLILGAGVAGLQAIATARRLGAVVRAYDVRAAAKEEVESLGATFVELPLETQEGEGGYAREQSEEYLRRQRELVAEHVAASDVVITTAAIPGRRAPLLVTKDMVEAMQEGSVIVDLAVDTGGNCELSQAGKDIDHNGVRICGVSNPPSSMPTHASFLFARNVVNYLVPMVSEGSLAPDASDEIVAATWVTKDGEVIHEATKALIDSNT